ncbi:B-cell CLL/lymphoma 9-like protein [Pipra filicauda]|uniref:B-cell CLL/lymphoma 9-like protein n=1 Tax=Pipra filicauda TaxID=649802 RepID=A0A7R5L259_9PASS|nr:B-cell CLL/lymphoma 9-like protein [Pipra filicauda]XP_039243320.1 B-cell CLL/lymphoma 9-like protein [Pipra filicauda]
MAAGPGRAGASLGRCVRALLAQGPPGLLSMAAGAGGGREETGGPARFRLLLAPLPARRRRRSPPSPPSLPPVLPPWRAVLRAATPAGDGRTTRSGCGAGANMADTRGLLAAQHPERRRAATAPPAGRHPHTARATGAAGMAARPPRPIPSSSSCASVLLLLRERARREGLRERGVKRLSVSSPEASPGVLGTPFSCFRIPGRFALPSSHRGPPGKPGTARRLEEKQRERESARRRRANNSRQLNKPISNQYYLSRGKKKTHKIVMQIDHETQCT